MYSYRNIISYLTNNRIMKPTEKLWKSIEDIYKAIISHPFITKLSDGTLDLEAFKYYVIQDSIYLNGFARALSILSSKAYKAEWVNMFARHASTAIEVERALHESFISEWGLPRQHLDVGNASPVNLAYINHLLSTVSLQSFKVGLASVLPCYWIYLEVGKYLESRGSPNRYYQRWIDTYSSKEYEKVVREVLSVADEVFTHVDQFEEKEIYRVFRISSIYEYLFWDSAYRLEKWVFQV